MNRSRKPHGFTLIEVMVALIIIAIGLLGIAKLQGLALSNTGVSSMRSLAALQATSLAMNMHANRAFWAANSAPSFTNKSVTTSTANNLIVTTGALALGTAASCQNVVCTPAQIAGYDVFKWFASLNSTLPNVAETVTCRPSGSAPVGCQINIVWTENMSAANDQEAAAQAAANPALQSITHPSYSLYVVP
jgi:type IV pilus assembly protein PilV